MLLVLDNAAPGHVHQKKVTKIDAKRWRDLVFDFSFLLSQPTHNNKAIKDVISFLLSIEKSNSPTISHLIEMNQSQSLSPLSFPCSSIAAIVGLHPFNSKNIPHIFFTYVYQHDPKLKNSDATHLNISLVSEQENISNILSTTPALQAKFAQISISKSSSLSEASSAKQSFTSQIDQNQSLLHAATTTLNSAKSALLLSPPPSKIPGLKAALLSSQQALANLECKFGNLLSSSDVATLKSSVRQQVDCNFGNDHEDEGLDEYERVTGSVVGERNTDLLAWNFMEDDEKEKNWEVVKACERGRGRGETKILFSCLGIVDGVAIEKGEKVVVEAKHRMNGRYFGPNPAPPPFYDLIQLVAYMLMLSVPSGDLLQCLRLDAPVPPQTKMTTEQRQRAEANRLKAHEIRCSKQGTPAPKPKPAPKPNFNPSPSSSPKLEINITRITLDSPSTNHGQNFVNFIVPKLYMFARAVHTVRASESLRHRLMLMLATGDVANLRTFFMETLGLNYVEYIEDFGGGGLEVAPVATSSNNSPSGNTRSKTKNQIIEKRRRNQQSTMTEDRQRELTNQIISVCENNKNSFAFSFSFPPALTSTERRFIHSKCEEMNIRSASHGLGVTRCIKISNNNNNNNNNKALTPLSSQNSVNSPASNTRSKKKARGGGGGDLMSSELNFQDL